MRIRDGRLYTWVVVQNIELHRLLVITMNSVEPGNQRLKQLENQRTDLTWQIPSC